MIDGNQVRFLTSSLRPGRVVCDCKEFTIRLPGDAPWCEHCDQFIEDGQDSRHTDGDDYTNRALPPTVEVVLQRRPGTRLVVSLESTSDPENDAAEHPDLRMAVVIAPQNPDKYDLGKDAKMENTLTLGYVRRDEGLSILRELVYDYLSGLVNDHLQCQHPYHVGLRDFTFSSMIDHGLNGKPLAQMVSLLTTDKCLECRADIDVTDLETGKPPQKAIRK